MANLPLSSLSARRASRFSLHPPLAGAAALACLLAPPLAHADEPLDNTQASELPVMRVVGERDGGLGLQLPSTSGSRTGIATQELPASLDFVDSETWQERGDSRMADIIGRTVGMVPLSATSYSSLSFSSRGFTGTNSVGIAEDGVRLNVASSTTPYPSDGWGYERVEVLRGPASILYGSGTVGATANVVRKQPSRELVREALGGAGSHGSGRLGVGLGGPLGEVVSYRLDAYGQTTDGERDFGRAHGGKIMSTLRVQPRADLRFELLADASDQRPERYFGTPVVDGRIVDSLRRSNYNAEDSTITLKDRRVRARAQWQVNDALAVTDELYHFRAKRHWKNIEGYRYNPTGGTIERYDYLEIGHDLKQSGNRLEASLQTGAHKLVAGWEVTQARFSYLGNSPYKGDPAISAPTVPAFDSFDRGPWASLNPTLNVFASKATTHDFYVEDAWTLGDRWLLLAGLRRDITDMQRDERTGGTSFDKTLSGTAWRLGATYKLDAKTSLYGQVSQGHDPVTNILTLNLSNSNYRLTTARQVEVGVKQQIGHGLGEWTAAAYRIEKKDIITRDPVTPSLSVQGGRQHSQGLELSGMLRLTPQWRVEANYALVDARFDELIEAGDANRAGNRPSNVARQSANLWAHYGTDSRIGRWQASLGARAVGSRYANNANTARSPGYTVWDAALSWRPQPHATFRLTLRNLADKIYTYSAISGSQAYLGDGRRVDVSAEFAF